MKREGVSTELRNCLWNEIYELFLESERWHDWAVRYFWKEFAKRPLDDLRNYRSSRIDQVKSEFESREWYDVYNCVELFAKMPAPSRDEHGQFARTKDTFVSRCNLIFEREFAAWRFLGKELVPITTEEELAAVQEASQLGGKFQSVSEHIKTSLRLLSDRASPDYRNSIKESISAVEAAVRILSGKEKAELGDGLNLLEKQGKLHGALKAAFSSLYGYTSDANGIRHALTEEPDLDQADAVFMLVTCSSFCNYLISKLSS